MKAYLATFRTITAAGGSVLLLFASPAETCRVPSSAFQTRLPNNLPSTHHDLSAAAAAAAAAAARTGFPPPRRSLVSMALSDSGGGGDGGNGAGSGRLAMAPGLMQDETGYKSIFEVGQLVLAVGNLFGLDHTLTMCVVSGLWGEVQSAWGSCSGEKVGYPPGRVAVVVKVVVVAVVVVSAIVFVVVAFVVAFAVLLVMRASFALE